MIEKAVNSLNIYFRRINELNVKYLSGLGFKKIISIFAEKRVSMLGEESFISRINRKQMSAFRKLFDELYSSLVYFAMSYVETKEVAEDIVQEVLAKVWENSSVYPSYNSLKTFLYTSIRNACLDYRRHEQVERRYLSQLKVYEETEEDFDLKVMEEELYHSLFAVVEELPTRCKEIFKLHLAGLRNEEIAKELNLSVATVKTQKKKAMAYLRKRFKSIFFLLLAFHLI